MGRIPEETVQQIIAATDIVALIGRSVKLRRAGSNWVGLCPFHTERSPSFNVYPHNHSYHCFGCKASGTAVRFLMEIESLQFTEAIKRLADDAGIRIQEEELDPEAERQAKYRAALRRAHEQLAEWYHHLLLTKTVADPARAYLKTRGITSDVAKKWLLGYAPEQSNLIRRWASDHSYSDRLLLDAGIYTQNEAGTIYPRFRNRLMFPIRSESGEVIAFSGRALEAAVKAKYLNSPESPIFTKGKVFFGFDKSKKAINKANQAIVCEGQIDLITAVEFGVQNIVAPLGTALTDAHARMLKQHVSEVVLSYDADNAGYTAAEKAYNLLSPLGILVRVASLPKGEDPDSLIRKQGVEHFKKLIDEAQDFLDFQINRKKASNGGDLRNQVMLQEQIAVTISMNPSPAARDLMIRAHSVQLNVTEDNMRRMVNGYVKRQQKSAAAREGAIANAEPKEITAAQAATRLLASQHKTALLFAHAALASPEIMEWLRNQDFDAILHDLPGTELLSLVWHTHFDPADSAARAGWISGLHPVEESAISQLMTRALPGKFKEVREDGCHVQEQIDSLSQDLYNLGTARLHHLIERAKAEQRQPSTTPERAAVLTDRVVTLHKEYLDRTRPR